MPKKKQKLLRALFFLCGVGMITLGAVRGEVRITLEKAARICLECIGIG